MLGPQYYPKNGSQPKAVPLNGLIPGGQPVDFIYFKSVLPNTWDFVSVTK